jgi:hypothetical protein
MNQFKIHFLGWALMVHACNPSYSEVRDQDDCGLKPAWANVRETYLETKKRAGGVSQVVESLSSSPSHFAP